MENQKTDLVIIDDNKTFTDSIQLYLSYENNKKVDAYNTVQEFLDELSSYDKNTKICTDRDLHDTNINGIELAEQLHEAGFTQLFLLTGWDLNPDELPSYLTIISKTDLEAIRKLAS